MPAGAADSLLPQLTELQSTVSEVNRQFQNPDLTTFVCVCISEFLSLYETERMILELTQNNIDTHNISAFEPTSIHLVVINQLLFPKASSTCEQCNVRFKMQQKYLLEYRDLYEDFHLVELPLLTEEVRGVEKLKSFSENLIHAYQKPR